MTEPHMFLVVKSILKPLLKNKLFFFKFSTGGLVNVDKNSETWTGNIRRVGPVGIDLDFVPAPAGFYLRKRLKPSLCQVRGRDLLVEWHMYLSALQQCCNLVVVGNFHVQVDWSLLNVVRNFEFQISITTPQPHVFLRERQIDGVKIHICETILALNICQLPQPLQKGTCAMKFLFNFKNTQFWFFCPPNRIWRILFICLGMFLQLFHVAYWMPEVKKIRHWSEQVCETWNQGHKFATNSPLQPSHGAKKRSACMKFSFFSPKCLQYPSIVFVSCLLLTSNRLST